MGWDRDGNYTEDEHDGMIWDGSKWIRDPSIPLSPMEQAAQTGGQAGADALAAAAKKYYADYPTGHPDGNATNWYDPASYSWLTNSRQTTQGGTPPPSGTSDDGTPPPSGTGGQSWFDVMSSAVGGPEPFPETYTALPRPGYLQGEYVTPQWTEQFAPPTMDDVKGSPGYQTRLSAGVDARDAMASARGSVLSGGHGKAMERFGQEHGTNEYANEYARRYGAFSDRKEAFFTNANLGMQGRQVNEGAYQSDVGNNLNQYLTRFNAYQAAIGNTRDASNDFWSQNMDVVRNDLQSRALSRPAV